MVAVEGFLEVEEIYNGKYITSKKKKKTLTGEDCNTPHQLLAASFKITLTKGDVKCTSNPLYVSRRSPRTSDNHKPSVSVRPVWRLHAPPPAGIGDAARSDFFGSRLVSMFALINHFCLNQLCMQRCHGGWGILFRKFCILIFKSPGTYKKIRVNFSPSVVTRKHLSTFSFALHVAQEVDYTRNLRFVPQHHVLHNCYRFPPIYLSHVGTYLT